MSGRYGPLPATVDDDDDTRMPSLPPVATSSSSSSPAAFSPAPAPVASKSWVVAPTYPSPPPSAAASSCGHSHASGHAHAHSHGGGGDGYSHHSHSHGGSGSVTLTVSPSHGPDTVDGEGPLFPFRAPSATASSHGAAYSSNPFPRAASSLPKPPSPMLPWSKRVQQRAERIVVPLFLALYVFVYYHAIVVSLDIATFVHQSSARWWCGVLLHVLAGLLLTTHLRCWLESPGVVVPGWERLPGNLDASHAPSINTLMALDARGAVGRDPNFCRKCQGSRPLRAHHCRKCDKCILRMDHHCPWIDNCVGYANYRMFLLFLFYLGLDSSIAAMLILSRLFGEPMVTAGLAFRLMFALTACAFALGMVYTQLKLIVVLVQVNMTKVEHAEKKFDMERAEFFGLPPLLTHKFDHGIRENLRIVFGSRWWLWLVPIYIPLGDSTTGYNYRTSPHAIELLETQQSAIDAKVNENLREAGLIK